MQKFKANALKVKSNENLFSVLELAALKTQVSHES